MPEKKKVALRPTRDKSRSSLVVRQLEGRVRCLEETIATTAPPYVATVATLAPMRFRLKKAIPVVLKPHGNEFVASFLDANINASGETEAEALDNWKAIMVTIFQKLRSLPAKTLGPGPARQLAVLHEFIEAR